MIRNIKEADKFSQWMRDIKNIHYSNNAKMLSAYSEIEALKMDYRL